MPLNAKPADILQNALETYSDSDRVRFLVLVGILNGLCDGNEALTRDVVGVARVYGHDRT